MQVATQLLQGFPAPNGALTGAVASDVPMPAASTASLASSLCSDGAFPAYTRIIHFSFNLNDPRLVGSKRSPGRPPPEGLESDTSFPQHLKVSHPSVLVERKTQYNACLACSCAQT